MENNKKKIIILDDNKEFVNLLSMYINTKDDMEVVGVGYDGRAAKELILKHRPDILLLDIVMPEKDGLDVIEDISRNKDIKIPLTIVMSAIGQERVTQKAIALGAMYYVVKPFDMATLIERLRDLSSIDNNELGGEVFSSKPKENKTLASLEVRVTNMIHDVGVPAHIKGYQYIRDGVEIIFDRPDVIGGITKELYPELASKFETTVSRVERAIRHAIEVSWNRGDWDLMEELFGHSVDIDKAKPTNSEFMVTIADKLRLEYHKV